MSTAIIYKKKNKVLINLKTWFYSEPSVYKMLTYSTHCMMLFSLWKLFFCFFENGSLCLNFFSSFSLFQSIPQPTNGEIIDNFLNLLDIILQGIKTLPQWIILQVQKAEAPIQLGDKMWYPDRSLIVSSSYTIHSQSWL